jgi:hypothetical protein
MLKKALLVFVGVMGTGVVVGQMKKQFSVENQQISTTQRTREDRQLYDSPGAVARAAQFLQQSGH